MRDNDRPSASGFDTSRPHVARMYDYYLGGKDATTPTPIYFREHVEIARFFDGFELVEPGLVTVDKWHPDSAEPGHSVARWLYEGVGALR